MACTMRRELISLVMGEKFPDDPFYKENRNGQHQIGDHHDTDKYESNHVFCPFCYRYLRSVPQQDGIFILYEENPIVAINLSLLT